LHIWLQYIKTIVTLGTRSATKQNYLYKLVRYFKIEENIGPANISWHAGRGSSNWCRKI